MQPRRLRGTRAERSQSLLLATVAAMTAVAVAQLADLGTFLRMVSVFGIEAEANPLVAHIATTLGVGALIIMKLGLIGFVGLSFALIARVRERLAASVVTLATLAGLIGAVSNLIVLG